MLYYSILLILIGYLLGSFPSALIFARIYGVEDIRKVESGTMGTYNVLRNAGRKAAIFTLVSDISKGVLTVIIARIISEGIGIEYGVFIAAYGAVLGHMFPVYVGFKGGKSLAVFGGCMLVLSFPVIAVVVIAWLLFYRLIGKIAISSLLAFSVLPPVIIIFYSGATPFFWFLLISGLTIGLRHGPQVYLDINKIKK